MYGETATSDLAKDKATATWAKNFSFGVKTNCYFIDVTIPSKNTGSLAGRCNIPHSENHYLDDVDKCKAKCAELDNCVAYGFA